MKPFKSSTILLSLFFLTIAVLTAQYCSKNQIDTKVPVVKPSGNDNLEESYRNIGWINDSRYRTGVYILTKEECAGSRKDEIDDRIRMESFKHLQKELNPSFNRNAAVQIKSLIDNYGKVITAGSSCMESNVYFFDIEKKDLKTDFINIKNLK